VHLAEAADHGLLGLDVALDGEAGVFVEEAVEGFGELLLVAVLFGQSARPNTACG
jgi:hypothetical protein